MGMGANALAEILIDLGACDGLDPEKCAKATLKMTALGEKGKPFAMKMMGEDFDKFKRQWRGAFEKFMGMERTKEVPEKTTGGLWEDVDVD